MRPQLTYIGGPTILIEVGGLRFLTDPTFDPAGEAYETPAYTLRKTQAPALTAAGVGRVDAVLLSHDHHWDNLDHAGKTLLKSATRVLTTVEGAGRLGGGAVGLEAWRSVEIRASDGRSMQITATPARHGPAGGDRGPVIGFALAWSDDPLRAIYVSGDTVWFEGVAAVAARFDVRTAVLFVGAAKVAAAGPSHLTMTADEAVLAAWAFAQAAIVPVHFEGWEHFTQSRAEVDGAFAAAGLAGRLRWLTPGLATQL